MQINKVETASLGIARVIVKNVELVGGEPKEVEQTYNLALDFNAVALALDKTGLDFMRSESWQGLSSAKLRTLCWCAFQRFHPEISEAQVGQMFSPADEGAVWNMLIELAFPGALDRISKAIQERKEAQPGESLPVAAGTSAVS
jgi:hypothetical protein